MGSVQLLFRTLVCVPVPVCPTTGTGSSLKDQALKDHFQRPMLIAFLLAASSSQLQEMGWVHFHTEA